MEIVHPNSISCMNNHLLPTQQGQHVPVAIGALERRIASEMHGMIIGCMETLVECFVAVGVEIRVAKKAVEECEKRTSVTGIRVRKSKIVYMDRLDDVPRFSTARQNTVFSDTPSCETIQEDGNTYVIINVITFPDGYNPLFDLEDRPVLATRMSGGMREYRPLTSSDMSLLSACF
jgi:hypothetical protein